MYTCAQEETCSMYTNACKRKHLLVWHRYTFTKTPMSTVSRNMEFTVVWHSQRLTVCRVGIVSIPVLLLGHSEVYRSAKAASWLASGCLELLRRLPNHLLHDLSCGLHVLRAAGTGRRTEDGAALQWRTRRRSHAGSVFQGSDSGVRGCDQSL